MNKTNKKKIGIDWQGLRLALAFCEHMFGLVALAFMGAGFVTVDMVSFKVLGMAAVAWAAVHIFQEVGVFNKRLDEIEEKPSKKED